MESNFEWITANGDIGIRFFTASTAARATYRWDSPQV